jgi:hypothetical protein
MPIFDWNLFHPDISNLGNIKEKSEILLSKFHSYFSCVNKNNIYWINNV